MIPKFRARKDKESNVLSYQNRGAMIKHIGELKPGLYNITFQPVGGRTDSDPLRAYYFSVIVKMLSDETGYTSDQMHENLKRKFAPVKVVRDGRTEWVDMPEEQKGDRLGFYQPVSMYSRKSEVPVGEKIKYNERIQRWAAQFLGMNIPDPNQG